MPDGGPGLPVLGSIFNAILGGVDNNLKIAFNFTAAWLNNLLHNIVGLFKAVGGFFRAVWDFLKHAWEEYIKKAIDWLLKHVRKVIDWLRRHAAAAIRFMQKIKKWYDQHILKQQLRMLQMIQRIRAFLGILKLFHVKWATKLDNSLADLQNRIEQSIALVRGHINGIINWLNAIYDPVWLAGRLHVGGFWVRELDAHLRAAGLGGLDAGAPSTHQLGSGQTPNNGTNAIAASMHQDTATGTGKFSEHSNAGVAAWRYQDRFGS